MKTAHVIAYFGSAGRAAVALGITHQAVYQWGENVPTVSRQKHIEALTRGAIKIDGTGSFQAKMAEIEANAASRDAAEAARAADRAEQAAEQAAQAALDARAAANAAEAAAG